MEEEPEEKDVKVILLGETGVGKTSIINRFINNKFEEKNEIETLGPTFLKKDIKKGNIIYKLQIWDSVGQEKYDSITKLFIKGSNIVLLVYSIDSRQSFERLNQWYSSITNILDITKYKLGIVASKSDLRNEEVVSDEEGKELAKNMCATFRPVSSKENNNSVNLLFDIMIDELSKINFESRTESYVLSKKNLKKKKKTSCCNA
jgi:small GTP-binding protein